ncbi:MAG: formylglycine-generating enzyme family protein [Bacteroidales bacterium]|nr:formylglycine-generating enzyme family protein [Bacteroidales bacterium]
MKKVLLVMALLALTAVSWAQTTQKVAILETVDKEDKVPYGVRLQLRSSLTYAITNTPGYAGLDRVDMGSITGEQNFQRTGMVSNDQIKKLGEMTGASLVLVAEAAQYGPGVDKIIITAKILDVETADIVAAAPPKVSGIDSDEMEEACIQLARKLLGKSGASNDKRQTGTATQGQNFTETAFGLNMQMVYVEGGTFTMGCTGDQGNECDSDESPNRMTTVGSFYIGMLEITQAQWQKVMGTSIYQQRDRANSSWSIYGVGADYPMCYVSWEEVKEFCARLSRQTGKNYTLPTEAEWEYAARGGNKPEGAKYSGGWSVDDVAWYTGNSNSSTHPCGTKRGNALGIYDMSGNVWEWCEDWYGPYLNYDGNNPKGATTGSSRVLRGGSWNYGAGYCRVADRGGNCPDRRYGDFGFRVVLH